MKVDKIEYDVARGAMSAATAFTKMNEHVQALKRQLGDLQVNHERAFTLCNERMQAMAAMDERYAELERQLAEAKAERQAWFALSQRKVDEIQALAAEVQALSNKLKAIDDATHSHIDGRDLLHELRPNGAHHIDIVVRINGEDRHYQGDWLKALTWARDGHNKAERAALYSNAAQPGQAQAKCGCKPFCEHHGRDEIEADAGTGEEFCNECAADGWSGELCWPSAKSCFPDDQKANEWERSFMCPEHAAEHVIFCAEDEDGNDDDDAPADQQEGGQEKA